MPLALLMSGLASVLAGTMTVSVCSVHRNWWPVMETHYFQQISECTQGYNNINTNIHLNEI